MCACARAAISLGTATSWVIPGNHVALEQNAFVCSIEFRICSQGQKSGLNFQVQVLGSVLLTEAAQAAGEKKGAEFKAVLSLACHGS